MSQRILRMTDRWYILSDGLPLVTRFAERTSARFPICTNGWAERPITIMYYAISQHSLRKDRRQKIITVFINVRIQNSTLSSAIVYNPSTPNSRGVASYHIHTSITRAQGGLSLSASSKARIGVVRVVLGAQVVPSSCMDDMRTISRMYTGF